MLKALADGETKPAALAVWPIALARHTGTVVRRARRVRELSPCLPRLLKMALEEFAIDRRADRPN